MPELSEIGLKLGADLPFFIHGHAAWAEGVGEKLQSIEPATRGIFLVHPTFLFRPQTYLQIRN